MSEIIVYGESVPLSDEDVARGSLEEGWMPTFVYRQEGPPLTNAPTKAETGTIGFFGATWALRRSRSGEAGAWMTAALHGLCMHKIRVVLEDDEELAVTEATTHVRAGDLILCEALDERGISRVVLCVEPMAGGKLLVRTINTSRGSREYVLSIDGYHIFILHKQPRTPFVLK